MSEPRIGHPGQMPFRLLLDEALRQARRHFRAIYPSVAIPLAVATTLAAVAQALWMSRMTEDLGSSPTAFWAPEVYLLALLNFGLLLIAVMAMQVGVMDAVTGRPVDMKRAWRFAARGRVLLTLFLSYLASVFSVVCCCIPALFVIPLLSFIPPVMVEEGLGVESFSRSAELAMYDPRRGFFERPLVKALVLLLVGVLLSTVLGFLVAVPFQIPMWVDIFRSAASGEDVTQRMPTYVWWQVPAQFLSALVSAALYLYMCFGIALLYFDTRARKEGSDLRGEIDTMFPGSPPPTGDQPF